MKRHFKPQSKLRTQWTRDYSNLPEIARFPQEKSGIKFEHTITNINSDIDAIFYGIEKEQSRKVSTFESESKLKRVKHNLLETSRYVTAYNNELRRLLKRNDVVSAIAKLDTFTRLNSLRNDYRESLTRCNSCYVCAKPLRAKRAYLFRPSDFATLSEGVESIDIGALNELRKVANNYFAAQRKAKAHKPNEYASYALENKFETVTFEQSKFGLEYHYADITPHFRVYQSSEGFLKYAFVDGVGGLREIIRHKVNGKYAIEGFTDSEGNFDRFYFPPSRIRRFNVKCDCIIK